MTAVRESETSIESPTDLHATVVKSRETIQEIGTFLEIGGQIWEIIDVIPGQENRKVIQLVMSKEYRSAFLRS